ncbi:MAG: hypothetical protein HKN85_02905 [Gammaproteobacteria bacterium]|nr:hypothetical protein [Gammaproteobacteria bacterium]
MSEIIEQSVNVNSGPKTHALVAYILLAIGLFTAIPMLFGGIWAMIKRSDATGTVYHSHYTNAIRTFWWALAWTIVGVILIFALIGYLVLCAVWIWVLYRLVNGFAKILADEPYPL